MKEKNDPQVENVAEAIRGKSVERIQRLMVDEVFPDGSARILVADMKSRKKTPDLMDHSIWHDEVEYRLDKEELSKLLNDKQLHELAEGKVFRIQRKRAKSIQQEVKLHVKGRTKELLAIENQEREELRR